MRWSQPDKHAPGCWAPENAADAAPKKNPSPTKRKPMTDRMHPQDLRAKLGAKP